METRRKVRGNAFSKLGGCMAVGFFLIFALAGCGAFYAVAWQPLSGLIAARGWVPATCTILMSEVEAGDETYRVAMTYRYQVNGQFFEGDRYDFSFGSTSGYDGKAEVVAAYPPGTETLCFVDPADPTRSVIDRSPGLFLLWGLFPLPFLAVGFGGLFFTLRSSSGGGPERKARHGKRRDWREDLQAEAVAVGGPLVLEPQVSPVGKLLGITAIAVFWNGIVGLFVYFGVFQSWRSGDLGEVGCLAIFLVPFVLVGLALLIGVPYQLLALFNPRPRLVLDEGRLEPGTRSALRWEWDGQASRLRRLTITLEGRESATYRQGTSSKTDHATFHEQVLVGDEGFTIHRGSVTLEIPEGTMPSFEAPNNKIEWRLKVHGDIPFWPDVDEGFPLTVHPPEVAW